MSELEEAVQNLVREREQRAAEAEELHRVVEAARRERVMAIDERDKMLHRSEGVSLCG